MQRLITLVSLLLVFFIALFFFDTTPLTENSDPPPARTETISIERERPPALSEPESQDEEVRETPILEKDPPPSVPLSATLAAREAVVNILCSTERDGSLPSVSGSGVAIDPRGIILTNAHLAQYLILSRVLDERIECVIRAGAPATEREGAELLYISPSWVEENLDAFTRERPTGTGEYDFAFLIPKNSTGLEDVGMLPLNLEASVVTEEGVLTLDRGMPVSVIGFPSEFLSTETIEENFFPLSADATVVQLFTFGERKENILDLVSLSGSILAQRGASGGAVIGRAGALEALVVTSTTDEALHDRTLRAITLSHIDRTLAEETGKGLLSFLEQPISDIARAFTPERRRLERLFEDEVLY